MSLLPRVAVVIPTHNRPDDVRRAIAAVRSQTYAGDVEVVVVFDRTEPDMSLESDGDIPVRVTSNGRTPGLAGGRNTGILATEADLVAFCDDDDWWAAEKLAEQVSALSLFPKAPAASCAITVDYEGTSTARLAGTDRVTHAMLLRSRMSMLHSSTLLFRRGALLGELGLIDEEIPGSQNEDWDILLRASTIAPIVHVDHPLVNVRWGRSSFFSRRWDTKIASSEWMLRRHEDLAADSRAAARLMGQIAFAHACSGHRREAWRWSGRAVRRHPTQWRAPLSATVAVWPPAGEHVLALLHRFGRGV